MLKSLLLLFCLFPAAIAENTGFSLSFDRLLDPLNMLNSQDRMSVDQAIRLIRSGEHAAALVELASLNQSNPKNSSLRILAAYAELQLGNLLGAYEDAKKGESAPNGNSYKCYFLSKLALLNGKYSVCKHELKHVQRAGEFPAEAAQLKAELENAKRR
jgi:hypothetical protein